MILRAYSIYDLKALQYHAPWFQSTDGAAVRMFSEVVNDKNTVFGRHPRDFVLFYIGTYDDQHGAMAPAIPLVHLVDGVSLVELPEAPLFMSVDGRPPAAPSNGEAR